MNGNFSRELVLDHVQVARRVWAPPESWQPARPPQSGTSAGRAVRGRRYRRADRGQLTLVFDTETTIDPTQRLLVGVWRLYRDEPGQAHPAFLVEEGILIPDDLDVTDPEGHALVCAYVASHRSSATRRAFGRLRLLTRSQFVEQLLWRRAYKQRALVVGFNLAFDLSRLAIGVGAAKGWFRGGFSLPLSAHEGTENRFRPRLLMRMVDSKRSEFAFSRPAGIDPSDQVPVDSPDGAPNPRYAFRGDFLDLRTLAFALTSTGHSLESASAAFGVPYVKRDAPLGVISEELIDYCREDVEATARLCQAALDEYRRHPIDRRASSVRSPASLAKGYLEQMGLRPPLTRQPDLDPELLGRSMSAYYGGRAECRIRRIPVPVVLCDFLSMYPTVNALMRSWSILCADRIEHRDVTSEVVDLLAGVDLDGCFDRDLWPRLLTLVEVEPAGEPLPVRARYRDPTGEWGIGLNHLTSSESCWYTLADLVAARVLCGGAPRVRQAVRLVPVGVQAGLRAVRLRDSVEIDPRQGDFFRKVIEERHRVRNSAGAYGSMSRPERDSLQMFLKVLANSGGYGIYAEMNAQEATGMSHDLTVYGAGDSPVPACVARPETPGTFCLPPLAACITGAARLMLALLEAAVREAGGTYAFCDTDSLAIVAQSQSGPVACPSGDGPDEAPAITALSWRKVQEIRDRFTALNPYDPDVVPGSILKIEDENFDPTTGDQRALWAYCISAKRYVLYTQNPVGSPLLCKASEHGLGHLLNPTDPDDPDRSWIHHAWEYLLACDGIGRRIDECLQEPDWLDRPALSRITVSSPEIMRLFGPWAAGRDYPHQIKPANFLLAAQVALFGHPAGVDPARFLLVAPYASDPRRWSRLAWRNRFDKNSATYTIQTAGHDIQGDDRVVTVKSYRQVLADYLAHPEAKSTGPDGTPCGPRTRGLLRRRALSPATISYIGKESNRLDDVQHGLVLDGSEVETTYATRTTSGGDAWSDLVVPVLRDIALADLCDRTGLAVSTLKAIRSGASRPRTANRRRLLAIAARHARAATSSSADHLGDLEACSNYLANRATPSCPECGADLAGGRATYCSGRCRQRAFRKHKANSSAPTTQMSAAQERSASGASATIDAWQ